MIKIPEEKKPLSKIFEVIIAIGMITSIIIGMIVAIRILNGTLPLNEYSVGILAITIGLPSLAKAIGALR